MFDPAEIRQRLKRVQAQVKQSGLDALVLCTDANIGYLIGLHCELGERMALLVVPAKGEPSLIVPRLEQEQMGEAVSVDNVLAYWEKIQSRVATGTTFYIKAWVRPNALVLMAKQILTCLSL